MSSKKVTESIYITSFAASVCILIYYCIVTTVTFFEYNNLKANLAKFSQNRCEILGNLWWAKWQRPPSVNQYMIMWLFNYDYISTINLAQDIDKGYGINMAILEIKGPIESYSGMNQRVLNPPFGAIQILSSKVDKDNNQYIMNIAWYSNSALPTNTKLFHPEMTIKLKLHSIVKDGNIFSIKLNNEWIPNRSKSQVYKNIQVVDSNQNEATLHVNTPGGLKTVHLGCGQEILINYVGVQD